MQLASSRNSRILGPDLLQRGTVRFGRTSRGCYLANYERPSPLPANPPDENTEHDARRNERQASSLAVTGDDGTTNQHWLTVCVRTRLMACAIGTAARSYSPACQQCRANVNSGAARTTLVQCALRALPRMQLRNTTLSTSARPTLTGHKGESLGLRGSSADPLVAASGDGLEQPPSAEANWDAASSILFAQPIQCHYQKVAQNFVRRACNDVARRPFGVQLSPAGAERSQTTVRRPGPCENGNAYMDVNVVYEPRICEQCDRSFSVGEVGSSEPARHTLLSREWVSRDIFPTLDSAIPEEHRGDAASPYPIAQNPEPTTSPG
ncbi:hypothetical protein C8Q74DRAFT_871163 [Fomes fomentarius]|nr:hypothetical protein C8Q74DRAFT_871163 [Fomes fomentarius]